MGWDGDWRLLVFTRSAPSSVGRPAVAYGRILDLRTLRVWPEMYLDSLVAPRAVAGGPTTPMPADRLLAMARVQPLAERD